MTSPIGQTWPSCGGPGHCWACAPVQQFCSVIKPDLACIWITHTAKHRIGCYQGKSTSCTWSMHTTRRDLVLCCAPKAQ
jgi:hypothetical protein